MQETWMTPIHNYICTGTLPKDKLQDRRLSYHAGRYVEYDGVLYKRGFNPPLFRCLDLEEGYCVLKEWAEAIPLTMITAKKIKDFIFNSIVCIFGISHKFISDNGKQFDNKELKKLCEDLHIKKEFAALYHPQSNGQTKSINKIIKYTLKAKLEEKKGYWPE
ncbi:uncharacterized protein LOC141685626 [Apium graveolens]|uniref:uncharacterized protein LOC141685626 n=1 Tax=Apium graveolens TaxID=4045 RepID=UPI003D79C73C